MRASPILLRAASGRPGRHSRDTFERRRMRNVLAFALVVAVCFVPCAASTRTLQIDDAARIANLEEPAISPDGRTVALLAYHQDIRNAADVPSLVLAGVRDGATQTLVVGRDVAVPRWSPDGGHLAYLATDGNGVVQIFLRSAHGTTQRITDSLTSIVDFQWRPDGRQIAYVAPDLPVNRAALAAHHDYFFAGNNEYTATALTPPDHLWIVDSRGGRMRRLTSGAWTVAPTDPGGIFTSQFAWSPDGRRIAFTRVATPFAGDDDLSTLWDVDAAGGAPRKLTSVPAFELSPSYSGAGELLYWYPVGGDFLAENTLMLRAAAGGEATAVLPQLDRNVAGALWLPDHRRLLICANEGTQVKTWTLTLPHNVVPFDLGARNIICDPYSSSTFDAGIAASFSREGGLAFLANDARHARELFYLARGARVPRQVTHFNAFVDSFAIGEMRPLQWTGPNGFAEDGVVTLPPQYDAAHATRFPIVLLIHGGPGLSNDLEFSWEDWPLAQLMAARGYVVFQPNYRGSDNLGNAYMIAIERDTAAGPAADVMAGLSALERQPYADASRVAVSGWSYGGLLTTWLIGHSHIWRSAVSGAAVNDETNEYDTSISNVQNRYYLGTSPYLDDGRRIYAEQSPITYYADITTPTLIWSTTQDPVVPISQSYALYHALTDNHIETKFLVFPADTHGPSNPVQRADLTRFWIDWIDTHE
jgi:dipeptidyl aminopeptidase/acylaminoacyl peptidase